MDMPESKQNNPHKNVEKYAAIGRLLKGPEGTMIRSVLTQFERKLGWNTFSDVYKYDIEEPTEADKERNRIRPVIEDDKDDQEIGFELSKLYPDARPSPVHIQICCKVDENDFSLKGHVVTYYDEWHRGNLVLLGHRDPKNWASQRVTTGTSQEELISAVQDAIDHPPFLPSY
jgi:hypothetical protein